MSDQKPPGRDTGPIGPDTPVRDAFTDPGPGNRGRRTRVANALTRAGCRTLGDVATHTWGQLRAMPDFGKVSMAEVEKVLAAAGMSLRDEDSRNEDSRNSWGDRRMSDNRCALCNLPLSEPHALVALVSQGPGPQQTRLVGFPVHDGCALVAKGCALIAKGSRRPGDPHLEPRG
jgi:Bacterial RNA polymerase, alpha chain C terminal domain